MISSKYSPNVLLFVVYLQQYLKPGEGPIVLVLAPTRELAVQIKEECDKFGKSSEIKNTVMPSFDGSKRFFSLTTQFLIKLI